MANQSGTLTSSQGSAFIGTTPNDTITFTPTGTYTVEYPLGTVAISASTGAQSLSVSGGQVRVTCASGSVAWAVSDGNDGTPLSQTELLSVRSLVSGGGAYTTDALVKWYGPTDANGLTFGETDALGHKLPFDWTTSLKAEIEAPFVAVRVVAWNRTDNALNLTGVLGVSEVIGSSTDQEASTPKIGGSFYGQIAPANTVNGFRRITWAGATQVTIPSAASAHQVSISDRMAMTSVLRAAGEPSARPILLSRIFTNGATAVVPDYGWNVVSKWVPSNLSVESAAPLAQNKFRQFVLRGGAGDYTTSVNVGAGVPLGSTASLEFGYIVTFKVPVISVWGCGDSIGNMPVIATQSEYINTWGMMACAEVSTVERPVVWATMAAAGSPALKSLALARQYLSAGCPPPAVLVVNPISANDDSSNWATEGQAGLQRVRDLAHDWIRLAREYRIPYMVWFPLLARGAMPLAGDLLRKQLNTELAATAASFGIRFLAFPGLLDGATATTENYVAKYNSGDNLHQNQLANTEVLSVALANVLRAIP